MAAQEGRRVYLVRHGETVFNREGRYNGQKSNSPLTEQGLQDATNVTNWFLKNNRAVNAVYSSPLERALYTAKMLHEATQAPLFIRPEITELNLGKLDGQLKSETETIAPGFLAERGASPHAKVITQHPGPDGESYEDGAKRVQPVVDEILKSTNEVTVVVGHQAISRAIWAGLAGIPMEEIIDYYQPHDAMIEIDIDHGTWREQKISTA